jgi:hypothetical protein
MQVKQHLQRAIDIAGSLTKLAKGTNIRYQNFQKWMDSDRMPRTEYTGETDYSLRIEKFTKGKVKFSELCPKIKKI